MQHQGPIAAVAAKGAYVATAGYDNRVILWDAATRRAIARGMHDHLANHCAFNSDGSLLLSAGSDYSARIWEVPGMRLKGVLTGHLDDVDMAVFSPDDTLIATCALDRKVRVFDVGGRCLQVFSGHTGNIISVAWSSDGKRLVSSSVDGTVREWDVAAGTQIRCNNLDGVRTDTLEIDSRGDILAGDDAGRIAIIIDGEVSYTPAHKAGVKKLAYDEHQGILVTLSYDRSIAIWKRTGRRELQEISRSEFPVQVWARSAALMGAHKIALGTFGSTFAVYDWEAGTWDLDQVVADNSLNAVSIVGEDEYAIGDAGVVFKNGKPTTSLGSLCNFLLAVEGRLFSGGQTGELFDAHSGEAVYQHHSPLNCGTHFLHAGARHFAIGTYTGEVLIFSLPAGGRPQLVTTLKVYENAVKGLACNRDTLFSVCASTAIAWHSLADFSLIRKIDRAHERIANGCCLAGEGFASIGRDLKLRLWIDGKEEVYQTPHPNSVKCICSSDDRNLLMTGAYTGTLACFDMRTRQWRSFERPTAAGISSITFDSGKQRFVASSYDGKLYAVNV